MDEKKKTIFTWREHTEKFYLLWIIKTDKT